MEEWAMPNTRLLPLLFLENGSNLKASDVINGEWSERWHESKK